MTPLEYGQAIELSLGTGAPAERKLSKLRCALEVVRTMGEYRPQVAPEMPSDIYSLHKLDVDTWDEMFRNNPSLARSFADWRESVTLHECENANRLYLLGCTVVELLTVRDAENVELVDRAVNALGNWISSAWRAQPPLDGSLRDWASRATRRTDLLPRAWRYV
jgi:hypothetical protein